MRKFITAFILAISFPINCYAHSDWIPSQMVVPSTTISIMPQPQYRLVNATKIQLVPHIVLAPMPTPKVNAFGRVIGQTVLMQPVTIYQWQSVTIQTWEKVLP